MVKRKSLQGTTTTSVDCRGYSFAKITGDASVILSQSGQSDRMYSAHYDGGKLSLDGAMSMEVRTPTNNEFWTVELYEIIPAVNQFELSITLNDTGKYSISGDDDILYRAQQVDLATVAVSDVDTSLESLAILFQTATASKSVNDAARYAKMRNVVMTLRN